MPASPNKDDTRHGRLGEALRQRGLVTSTQLQQALEAHATATPPKPFGEVLVDLGFVKAADIVRTLAEMVGKPFVELTTDQVQPDAMDVLPQDFLERHNALPLSRLDGVLTIAVEEFTNVLLLDEIARQSRCKIRVVAAMPENIRQTRQNAVRNASRQRLSHTDEGGDGSFDGLLGQIDEDDLRVIENKPENDAALEVTVSDSPVVTLVNLIIKSAVRASASDIHIEPDEPTFRIRYRIDGDLVSSIRPSSRLLAAVVSRIKILAGMDISQRRLPQDGGVTVNVLERAVDLRVSTMAGRFGEKVVIRIVDRDAGLRTLNDIGIVPSMLATFREVVQAPNGIVLVTGPTGSGKSTTLYGVLSEIVTDQLNVSTIEDPVERVIPGVNQFQIQSKAGFTFASALRSMLRQDPDVIMVGEIRDSETAKLATEAALTGHLVLSTLHTNDAPTAIPRLINMGVEPYLVAATLRGVLAQRLVRKVCPSCAHATPLTPAQLVQLSRLCGGTPPLRSTHIGRGCAECAEAGTRGRIGVFELLVPDEAMLSAIVEDGRGAMRDIGRRLGSNGLLGDGLAKVQAGVVTIASLLELVARTDGAAAPPAPPELQIAAA